MGWDVDGREVLTLAVEFRHCRGAVERAWGVGLIPESLGFEGEPDDLFPEFRGRDIRLEGLEGIDDMGGGRRG